MIKCSYFNQSISVRMKSGRLPLFGWVLLVGLGLAWGSTAGGDQKLYELSVPVANKSAEARAPAFSLAMENLLVRLTGQREWVAEPQIKARMTNPEAFIQQYWYEEDDATSGDRLFVKFDEEAIKHLLQQAGAPIITKRPNVLLWLAMDDGLSRKLVSESNGDAIAKTIAQHSALRGLRVVFPLLDLRELREVTVNDVWSGFFNVVGRASHRYNSDEVLIGKISLTRQQEWKTEWFLLNRHKTIHWQVSDQNLEIALRTSIDQLFDKVTRPFLRHQVVMPRDIRFEVNNVDSLSDYLSLLEYLENLPMVQKVSVAAVKGDQLTLSVNARAEIEAFNQRLKQDRKLLASASGLALPTDGVMHFRFVPSDP